MREHVKRLDYFGCHLPYCCEITDSVYSARLLNVALRGQK